MARRLQIKRGLLAEMPILAEGELGYATDTNELYIGTAEGVNVRTSPLFDEGITTNQVLIEGYGPESGIFFDGMSDTEPVIYLGDYDETVIQSGSSTGAKLSLYSGPVELDAPDGLTIKLDGNHELNFAYDVGDGNEAGMVYSDDSGHEKAIATYRPDDKTFRFADGAIKVDSAAIRLNKDLEAEDIIISYVDDDDRNYTVILGTELLGDDVGLIDGYDNYLAVMTYDNANSVHHFYANGMIDANIDERTLEIEGYVKQAKYDELKQELDALKPSAWEEILSQEGIGIRYLVVGDIVYCHLVNPDIDEVDVITLPFNIKQTSIPFYDEDANVVLVPANNNRIHFNGVALLPTNFIIYKDTE